MLTSSKVSLLEKVAADSKTYGDYRRGADSANAESAKLQARIQKQAPVKGSKSWHARGSLKRAIQRRGQVRLRGKARRSAARAAQANANVRSFPKARRGHQWSVIPDKKPLKPHVGKGTLGQRRAQAGSPVSAGYKLHKDEKRLKRHVGKGTAGQRIAEGNYKATEVMGLVRRAAANRSYSPWKKLQGELAGAKSKGRELGSSVMAAKAKAKATAAAAKTARYGAPPSQPGPGWFKKLTERKKALGTLSQALADNS